MILSIFQKFVMKLERKDGFGIERKSCKVLNSYRSKKIIVF